MESLESPGAATRRLRIAASTPNLRQAELAEFSQTGHVSTSFQRSRAHSSDHARHRVGQDEAAAAAPESIMAGNWDFGIGFRRRGGSRAAANAGTAPAIEGGSGGNNAVGRAEAAASSSSPSPSPQSSSSSSGQRTFLDYVRGFPFWILFALIYVLFLYAVLLQTLVTRVAVDPAEWKEKLTGKAWLGALLVFAGAVSWCFLCPLLLVTPGSTLQYLILPSLGFAVACQLVTYIYATLRPELCSPDNAAAAANAAAAVAAVAATSDDGDGANYGSSAGGCGGASTAANSGSGCGAKNNSKSSTNGSSSPCSSSSSSCGPGVDVDAVAAAAAKTTAALADLGGSSRRGRSVAARKTFREAAAASQLEGTNWKEWRNWLCASTVLFEHIQINAALFHRGIPWNNGAHPSFSSSASSSSSTLGTPFNATSLLAGASSSSITTTTTYFVGGRVCPGSGMMGSSGGSGGSGGSTGLISPTSLVAMVNDGGTNPTSFVAGNSTSYGLAGWNSTAANATAAAGTSSDEFSLREFWNMIFIFLFSEDVCWYLSSILVGLYALLVGLFIEQERCATDPLAPLLFEFLSGTLSITIFGSLLRVARDTHDTTRLIHVLLFMIYYTSTSVFVSVYRGDQILRRADVVHAPRFLILERTFKGLYSCELLFQAWCLRYCSACLPAACLPAFAFNLRY